MVVALVGGFVPAMVAAVGGSLLLNYFFAPPLHTFTIRETNNVLALGVFVVVAVLVSSVVDLAARRTRQAARATAEAETLGTLAGSVLRGETALPALLERVREAFGLSSVTLLELTTTAETHHGAATRGPADEWTVVASAGTQRCERPQDADTEVPAGDTLVLALRGRPLLAEDQRVVGAFAAQAAVILERHRLAEAAAAAEPLAEADRTRTALLAAVGHDLRSPLASAKAAVTSLRSEDVSWTPQDHDELLLTADESLDQLARLVSNLLDMSRLRAGAMSVLSRPVALDDVVPLALDELGSVRAPGRGRRPGRPAVRPGRRGAAGTGGRQPGGQRAPVLPARHPTGRHRQQPRRPGGAAGHRPRTGHPPGRPGTGLHALPAARRHRQHHGSRPRAGTVARPVRGDGRQPHPGGDPGRRPDDGRLAARRTPTRRAPGGDATRPARAGAGGRGRPGRAPSGPRMTRVLVIDDEPQILRALSINLRARHYEVTTAATGTEALSAAARDRPDLVILDLGLPDLDGVDVVRGLRGWSSAPIIILSGRSDSADKVDALDAGADDYLTKPFAVDELLARIRAVSRRATPADDTPVVTFGAATVDLAARRVTVTEGAASTDVRLTPTEWHLLEVLLRHPGKLLSQRQLLAEVWGPGYETAGGNLRVYMAQLRRKLEPNPGRPRHLLTEPGMGYRFQPNADS